MAAAPEAGRAAAWVVRGSAEAEAGGMGGGRSSGERRQQVKGTVRWESAHTILDAFKTPLPKAFERHYVISVSGFRLAAEGGRTKILMTTASPLSGR